VKSKSQNVPGTPEKPNFHFCMDRAACCREEMKNAEGDESSSPDTKELNGHVEAQKEKTPQACGRG